MMKKIYVSVLFLGSLLFAQDALREAVNSADYDAVRQMVKKNEIEEVYCGKMPPDTALQIYGKIFKAMPEQGFISCPLQFSFAYGAKVCSDKKQLHVCMDVIQYLQMESLQGNLKAVNLFNQVSEVAIKNKAYQKPIKEKVDTLVWNKCPKKQKEACIEACQLYADSTGDTLKLQECLVNPIKGVLKKKTVTKPSPLNERVKDLAIEGFWNSPISLTSLWLKNMMALKEKKVIPDSLVPDMAYLQRVIEVHKEKGTVLPGKDLFRFCAGWNGSVDSLFMALELSTRCPVFIGVSDARDGKLYKAIDIQGSIWIVENINYEIAEESICYDREDENCKVYGRLYTWDAAQMACPEGYRLSKDSDWEKLETLAGGLTVAANKLKSNSTDDYAFSVMFGGYANKNQISTLLGEGAYFWTELEADSRAIARSIFSSDEGVERFSSDKKIFMSVRCVKEN